MPYVLDGIIIIIFILCVFLSVKKGFIPTAIEVAGFIAALIIAFTFSSPLTNIIYDSFIEQSVNTTVEKTIDNATDKSYAAVDTVWNKMPEFITQNDFFPISKEEVIKEIESKTDETNEQLAYQISNTLVKPPITKIISVLISIIILSLLSVLVKLLARNIKKIYKDTVIGDADRLLGGLLGVLKGVFVSLCFCLTVSLLLSFNKDGFLIFRYDFINSTYIFKYLMELLPI